MLKQKPVKKRKKVSCDELSRILCFEGVEESARTQSEGNALEGCIQWYSATSFDDKGGWDIIIFYLKNLEIEITDNSDKNHSNSEVDVRYGLSSMPANLHFENCHFLMSSNIDEDGIKFFPVSDDSYHRESLYFVGNKNTGGCSFSFPSGSSVVFDQNNFTDIIIRRNDGNDSNKMKCIYLEFKRNKFRELDLDFPFPFEYSINCHFVGGNEIDILKWNQLVDRRKFGHLGKIVKYDDVHEYNLLSISFERSEKIGWGWLNTRYVKRYIEILRDMKDLFVRLKNLAHVRGDIGQENIISSYISIIEYAGVKNSKWYKSWRGWQDWLLLGWRWISSRFYTSWIRPISLLLLGYFLLNAIPFIWAEFDEIKEVSSGKYWDFCVYTPAKIFLYADNLRDVLGNCAYANLKREFLFGEVGLSVIGIFRLVWIWLCGAAFRNAIKTYSSR